MEIKPTLILDSSDSLSRALTQLDASPAVIVTKDGRYYGIIDHRCVTQSIRDPHNVKCETVISKPPVLPESAGVLDRMEAFLSGHFKALPVLDESKKPLGITTRVELLTDMLDGGLIPQISVSELMSSPAYTIDENASIAAAKGALKEKKAHRLVVTRLGKLIGVVSNFDIGTWSGRPNLASGRKDIRLSQQINVDEMRISSFLRPDVTLVKEGSSLSDAAKRMVEKQVSTVIIVSDGRPLGVISALDIFRKVQELAQECIPIQVSGLDEEDIGCFERIQSKFGHVLERFKQTFNIRNCSVHVKGGKSTYVVAIYLDTDRGHVSLKCERGSLQEGIDELAAELHEVLRKKKELRKPKPRVTHKRGKT
jgi:CBS domain-containing protein/ribosome-associated translation inhibitor RaiA